MKARDLSGLPALGTTVRVYRNLQRKDAIEFSVQTRQSDGWHVVAYVDAIALRDARFVVSDATRARVIRLKRRKVCAWIEATLCACPKICPVREVRYNPYRSRDFTLGCDGAVVQSADVVVIRDGAVLI